jgi:ABC-type bacteriocin/lantibiotic exporter with double-glycine peptidase domain
VSRWTSSTEIGWLVGHIRGLHGLFAIRLSAMVLASLLSLIDPLLLKWIIDEILPWQQADMLIIAACGIFGVFLARFAFASIGQVLDIYAAQRLMFCIRCQLLRHLQRLSNEYYSRTPRGEILHRFEQDVDQICVLGSHTLASLLRVLVMTLLTVVIMGLLNWKLTLVILPLVPLMSVLRRWSHRHLKRASERVQEASAQRLKFFENHMETLTHVQLLNRTAGERRRFAKIGHEIIDTILTRRTLELRFSFCSQITLTVASASVLWFGGTQVLQGTLTIGGLVAFYSYLNRIFEPVLGPATGWGQYPESDGHSADPSGHCRPTEAKISER